MRSVIALHVRSELRHRWLGLLVIAVGVGLVASTVMAAGAGARRNASALDRFRATSAARDVQVQVDDEELREPVFERLANLPSVLGHGQMSLFPLLPESLPELEFDLALVLSPDAGYGEAVDRGILLDGRRPHPTAADEVMLNELAASATGLELGDRVQVTTFTPEELDYVFSGQGFLGFGGPTLDLEVVGVIRQVDELQGDTADTGLLMYGTPALFDSHGDEMGGLSGMWGGRLDGRPGDIDEVRQAVREVAGLEGEVFVEDARTASIADTRDAISVSTSALVAFAIIAALAGAFAVGGVISRHLSAPASAMAPLRALGMPARARVAVLVAPIAMSAAVGALLGITGALLASQLTPIGLARRAEPVPGMRFDPLLLPGGVIVVAIVLMWAVIAARRLERTAPARRFAELSPVGSALARLDLRPRMSLGVRAALDRRSQPNGVPVRTALAVAALGVAGAVASLVVVTSFDELVDNPSRYGWGWSSEPDAIEGIEPALASLQSEPAVAGLGVLNSATIVIDGMEMQGISLRSVRGDVAGVLRSGRLPSGPHEVALGSRTASDLGVDLGDSVEAETSDGDAVTLTVVGVAVFRPVDNPNPGGGALLTSDGLVAVKRSDGFDSIVVEYAAGIDVAQIEAELTERHPVEFSSYSRPRLPGAVANLRAATSVVSALSAFFVVLGVAGVAHALAMSIRRRRHDLIVLRSLGMRPSGIRAIVRWQALATMATGLLVGTPLGLAAGRAVWRMMIGDVGVIDVPSTPVFAWGVMVVVTTLLALTMSSWLGRVTSKLVPSSVLRDA